MQCLRWISFCIMEPGVRWFVHFLPSGGNVTPPYPAECRLKVFQDGWGERTVLLEGAKLSQPDGVGVLDAFPELFESPAGVYGLVIELSTKQPRTDLTASGCIMEYEREGGTTKFIPHALFSNTDSEEGTASTNSVEDVIKEGNVKPSALAPLFGDAFIQSSLVAGNASEAGLIPGLQAWNGGSELVSISEILREADRDNANRDNANQDNAARVLACLLYTSDAADDP